MDKHVLRNGIFQFLLACILVSGIPLYFFSTLRPDRDFYVYLGLSLFLILLGFLVVLFKKKKIVSLLFKSLSILWAVFLLLRIVIIPFSSYTSWFSLARRGMANGTISSLFTGIFFYCGSLLVQFIYKNNFLSALSGIIVCSSFLLLLITNNLLFFIIFIVFAALFYFFVRYKDFKGLGFKPYLFFLIPLGFCFLLIGVSFPFFHSDGNRFVDRFLYSGTRGFIARNLTNFPLLESVPGYGYGYSALASGASPVLTSGILFEVNGQPGERYYLRDDIFSSFIEGRWVSQRIEVTLPQVLIKSEKDGNYTTVSGGDIAESWVADSGQRGATESLDNGLAAEDSVDLRIKVRSDFTASLPYTLNTEKILINRDDFFPPLDEGGTLFIDPPFVSGESYGLIFNADYYDTEEPDSIYFTQTNLSEEIIALAKTLKDPGNDPLLTAENIQRYLSENYVYSLETEIPLGTDMVTDFLFNTGKGYCLHFAGSFILLYRACGFPARLCSGYLVQIPRPEDLSDWSGGSFSPGVKLVTGYSSHTWPEIWLEGKGWKTLEVTPPLVVYQEDVEIDELTARQLNYLIGSSRFLAEKVIDRNLLLFLTGCLVVFISVIILFFALHKKRLLYYRVKSSFLIQRIVFMSRRLGAVSPVSGGWIKWQQSMEPLGRPAVNRRAAGIILAAIYSSTRGHSERDIRYLKTFLFYLGMLYFSGARISTEKGSSKEAIFFR